MKKEMTKTSIIRLDQETNEIAQALQKKLKLNTKTKAIRFVIHNYAKKIDELMETRAELEKTKQELSETKRHISAYSKAVEFFLNKSGD